MQELSRSLLPHISQLSKSQLEELYSFLGDYERNPVCIEEFLTSNEFLGPYFQEGLYPYWREVLKKIYPSPFYSPFWMVSLRGAIGIGKTTVACTGILYQLHILLSLVNPQRSLGLIPSTKIVFAIFNVTMSLATDVIWDQLTQMFTASPYFSEMMGILGTKPIGQETLFPKRVDFVMGSRIGHSLGKAVISAILDEANFDVIGNQVYENFNSLVRRMQSRFMQAGGSLPGKIWLVSSETDKSSTVNRIIDNYRKDPGVLVVQEPIWVVKSSRYGRDRFPVFKGSDIRPPEILSQNDQLIAHEPENILWVPTEHKKDFEADIDMALRDLGGISTGSSYRLFKLKDRLHRAAVVTPIFPEIIRLDFDDEADQILNSLQFKGYFSNPINKRNPRYIHMDIGLTGDRLGLAASYVSGFQERISRDIHTFQEVKEQIPQVVNEWALTIEPTPGKQVPLYKIRIMLLQLSKAGYLIGGVSADGYQSSDMLQTLLKLGFTSELLSLDRTNVPYMTVRSAIYEGSVKIVNTKLLVKELEELEVTPDGQKIDHPVKGSKDMADAVCGSVYMAMKEADKSRLLAFHDSHTSKDSLSQDLKDLFWNNPSSTKLNF